MSNQLTAYSQLLRDPRWQRKRLEVLQAHNFTCEECQATDQTLHVHHGYYEKGKSPWEYDNDTLHCLCEDCHLEFDGFRTLLQREIGRCGLKELQRLLGYVESTELHNSTATESVIRGRRDRLYSLLITEYFNDGLLWTDEDLVEMKRNNESKPDRLVLLLELINQEELIQHWDF